MRFSPAQPQANPAMSSKQGGKAKPLKQPTAEKKDYDEVCTTRSRSTVNSHGKSVSFSHAASAPTPPFPPMPPSALAGAYTSGASPSTGPRFPPMPPPMRPNAAPAGAFAASGGNPFIGPSRLPPMNVHLPHFPGWYFWDGRSERAFNCPPEVLGVPTYYDYVPGHRYDELMRMVAGLKKVVIDITRQNKKLEIKIRERDEEILERDDEIASLKKSLNEMESYDEEESDDDFGDGA